MLLRIKHGSTYGKLTLLIGLIVLVPLLVLPFYPQEVSYAPSFLIPAFFLIAPGIGICLGMPARDTAATEWQSPMQRGSLPVLFSWCLAILAGAVPFTLSNRLPFLLALFESVSGWTTTGFTVADIPAMPQIFLFHRAFMQYCGGLGFVMMIVVLVHEKKSMDLYNAEGHPDQLMPSLRKTARIIVLIYNGFLAGGVLAYCMAGMGFFDAVCHTMSALSTAGFSTQAASIGAYSSLAIELITVVLMLIGASNFSFLVLLVKGDMRSLFKVTELRIMLGITVIFTALSAVSLALEAGFSWGESFRNALFGVVTTFSTTGYSTMDYAHWPSFALGLLVILMIIGGCTGSTAGGIKMSRTYFLLRVTQENIKKKLSPARKIVAPSYTSARGKTPIDDALIENTFGFVFCYTAVFILGTLLMTLTEGCSLFDAMFEFASALGTVGISNGVASAGAHPGTLIIAMAGMFLGRLEIYIVLIGVFSAVRSVKKRVAKIRMKRREK